MKTVKQQKKHEVIKTVLAAIDVALVLLAMTYIGSAEAQQQWVTCKNIETGEVQSFPDRCPTWGWMPA